MKQLKFIKDWGGKEKKSLILIVCFKEVIDPICRCHSSRNINSNTELSC